MSRKPRELSSTGIYHVTNRGIDLMPIFKEEMDYRKYLRLVDFYRKEEQVQVLAYCLMNNHVHLVVRCVEDQASLRKLMQKVSSAYVLYFNKKYARIGPLFQDRFFSRCIESKDYLMAVFRYVHQNPVKAYGIHSVGDYRWSSYFEYLGDCPRKMWQSKEGIISVCDTSWSVSALGFESAVALSRFANTPTSSDEEKVLHFALEYWRIPECEVEGVIGKTGWGGSDGSDPLDKMSHAEQVENIEKLFDMGLSGRQILLFIKFKKKLVYDVHKAWKKKLKDQ